jgi:hypothetical protein
MGFGCRLTKEGVAEGLSDGGRPRVISSSSDRLAPFPASRVLGIIVFMANMGLLNNSHLRFDKAEQVATRLHCGIGFGSGSRRTGQPSCNLEWKDSITQQVRFQRLKRSIHMYCI